MDARKNRNMIAVTENTLKGNIITQKLNLKKVDKQR